MSFLPSRIGVRLFTTLGSAALCCTLAHAQQPYKVLDHWKIGGTGGWDYLLADPSAHLLYVTHGPRVEVIDTDTGKPVAAITGLKGTHGIALDSDGKFGYISDGGSNDVLVFDRHSFKTVTTVPAGTGTPVPCGSRRSTDSRHRSRSRRASPCSSLATTESRSRTARTPTSTAVSRAV